VAISLSLAPLTWPILAEFNPPHVTVSQKPSPPDLWPPLLVSRLRGQVGSSQHCDLCLIVVPTTVDIGIGTKPNLLSLGICILREIPLVWVHPIMGGCTAESPASCYPAGESKRGRHPRWSYFLRTWRDEAVSASRTRLAAVDGTYSQVSSEPAFNSRASTTSPPTSFSPCSLPPQSPTLIGLSFL
jgi:hypothetical protein